ncbi:MAG: phosphatase PAP2 family protein [Candidatus Thorarchaeota archaeon]
MLDQLLHVDRAVFLFINGSLANPVTDWFMPIVTNDNLLRVTYGVILLLLFGFGRQRLVWPVVFSLVVVALADQTASALLKPWIERLRPCRVMEVRLLVGCGAGYSFPSSHATNLFGQALFFGLLFKKYLPYAFGFAFLVGVSRIFVGVHYPLDVAAGMVIGGGEGAVAAYVLWKLDRWEKLKPRPLLYPVFATRTDSNS